MFTKPGKRPDGGQCTSRDDFALLLLQDVEAVIRAQKRMLQRFEKTNEMLANCNTLSATRLERATRDFKGG